VGALLGREVLVAARQREPVRVADRRHRDDLDRYVQVAHHPPDAGELLRVLLPEVGDVGCGEVQELEYDGDNPVEVARPAGPFEDVADRAGADADDRLARVDLGRERCETCDNCVRTERREAATERAGRETNAAVSAQRRPRRTYAVGEDVRVPRYGSGRVRDVAGEEVTIEFPNGEARTFLRSYVRRNVVSAPQVSRP